MPELDASATHPTLDPGGSAIYRIPNTLDLSSVIGEFTTQVRVGQFELQFTFGTVNFAVQSQVQVFRGDVLIARWEEGAWPDPGFFDIMNTPVCACDVVGDRQIVLGFENGLTMYLVDDSDWHECLLITVDGNLWVI